MDFQFDFSALSLAELQQPAIIALQQHISMQTLTPQILRNLRAQILSSNEIFIQLLYKEEPTILDSLQARNLELRVRLDQMKHPDQPIFMFACIGVSWAIFLVWLSLNI